MEIEVRTDGKWEARLTLTAAELYYLKVALERASYMDTDPADQVGVLNFAEGALKALQGHAPGRPHF